MKETPVKNLEARILCSANNKADGTEQQVTSHKTKQNNPG